MSFVERVSIRIKLAFLAGIPVVGALLLAGIILHDARQRSAAADALGSVEDLALLSAQMGTVVRALQIESARVTLSEGLRAKSDDAHTLPEASPELLTETFAETDSAIANFEALLDHHDLSRAPPRLARDLKKARDAIRGTRQLREKISAAAIDGNRRSPVRVDEIMRTYGDVDDALISATAALAYLAEDAVLLRSITSLVALSELTERCSNEHALLNDVFAENQFPPGTFKTAITLTTEQAIYAEIFRENASDADVAAYDLARSSETTRHAIALRDRALATTDDALGIDVAEWSTAEEARLAQLREIQHTIAARISQAAARKMQATRFSFRVSGGLSAFILVVSGLLAWLIARGITRTILSLSSAAERVRTTKDFSVRAQKTSEDELGNLTDAFNEMLVGVQARDSALESHRNNLEQMVEARTAELATKNDAMRLVLDNVEQGLAMVRADGTFVAERSAAFDLITGAPEPGSSFAHHLAGSDPRVFDQMNMSWEMAREGLFPLEHAIDQLPHQLTHGGSHLTVDYKPILRGEEFQGALLVVSDVTAEVQAKREQEAQGEYIAIFERVMQDREGFVSFAAEIDALLDRLARPSLDVPSGLALLHTIKGNAAQWAASRIAKLAHELETEVIESRRVPSLEERQALIESWRAVTKRLRDVVSSAATNRIDATRDDIDALLRRVRAGAPSNDIADALVRMMREPVSTRFGRLEDQIERLAKRLGKPKPRIVLNDGGVRVPTEAFAGFWASAIHVMRNMMDHGIERPDVRIAAGKSAEGTILLQAEESSTGVTFTFSDDGRGVDWAALGNKARAAGLPAATQADLEEALFHSGISTAEAVSDVSGRGVGMSAVLEECRALGGSIAVESHTNRGLTLVFRFPNIDAIVEGPRSVRSNQAA